MKLSLYCLAAFFLLSTSFSALAKEKDRQPLIKIRQLSSIEEPSFTEIQIHHNHGIGKAEFRAKDLLPGRKLAILIFLHGLESFCLDTGRLSLKISVNSNDGSVRQYISKTDSRHDIVLHEKSLFCAQVRKYEKEGYFEIIVPPAVTRFFRDKVKISWIDFFR
ncbi:MAG: hypothetical protein Kow0029_10040 [Candidatus Rifleibacteriota bacterium]